MRWADIAIGFCPLEGGIISWRDFSLGCTRQRWISDSIGCEAGEEAFEKGMSSTMVEIVEVLIYFHCRARKCSLHISTEAGCNDCLAVWRLLSVSAIAITNKWNEWPNCGYETSQQDNYKNHSLEGHQKSWVWQLSYGTTKAFYCCRAFAAERHHCIWLMSGGELRASHSSLCPSTKPVAFVTTIYSIPRILPAN